MSGKARTMPRAVVVSLPRGDRALSTRKREVEGDDFLAGSSVRRVDALAVSRGFPL
mgnify:CR=1 FL=1